MELFQLVFNPNTIYDTLFFNVKSVTQYKDVWKFMEADKNLFEQWKLVCESKYNVIRDAPMDSYMLQLNDLYETKAIFYPEFSKIVAITYATVSVKDNKLIRDFKKIVNNDEFTVVKTFREVLLQISKDGVMSKPQHFPTMCGHNIINNDIPLFLKRLIALRDKFEDKNNLIPLILKRYLASKPWDNDIIDTINLWKFNGFSNTPLPMICDYLGLKRNVEIMEMDELSQNYWDNIGENEKETLEEIGLQSANQTNLAIQLMNEMRIL